MEKLRELRNQQIIKLIVGVRGCGKSSILEMLRSELLESCADHRQVRLINFEELKKAGIEHQWRPVYDRIVANLLPDKMNYILLDEVQNVSQFEKMLDGLCIKKNVDIYATGSNIWFLSSNIATLLSGRYVEIQTLPLSFKEYLEICGSADNTDIERLFQSYTCFGAFPKVAKLVNENNAALVSDYLTGLYNTAMVKDVMAHASLSNARAATNIMSFMLDNIGRVHSPKSISEALTAGHQAVSRPTVASYLDTLAQAFLLYPVERYDIKAQRTLQNLEKYYAVDVGLIAAVLGARAETDSNRILENIVYLELLRRENIVQVGRLGEKEIGFVVTDTKGQTIYCQVAQSAHDDKLHHELALLRKIDSDAKYLLTLDQGEQDFDGIQQVNVINWLLGQQLPTPTSRPIMKKPPAGSKRDSPDRTRNLRRT